MVTNVITVTTTGVAGQLAELPQPVKCLYYRGDLLELLSRPRVAIVGSRKVSPYGQQVTTQLARELTQAGVVVISGLAYGVDSIAHRATLDAGGQTIAILPCGLSKTYPTSHSNLAKQILEQGGALASEYQDDVTTIMKYQFIARNRIIAGLSDAVLITEAAQKSGSLHTAQFALEQGVEVLAVPGNITSSTSGGTNQLIKSGATPITTTQDVLDILNIKPATYNVYKSANAAEGSILKQLRQGPVSSTTLMTTSKLSVSEFQQTLSLLEIKGVVTQTPSQTWILQ